MSVLDLPIPRQNVKNVTKLGETALGVITNSGDLFVLGPDHCTSGVGNNKFEHIKQPAIALASVGKKRTLVFRADGVLVRCEKGEISVIEKTSSGDLLGSPRSLLVTEDGGVVLTEKGIYTLTVSDSVSLTGPDLDGNVTDLAGSETGNTTFALSSAAAPAALYHRSPPTESAGPNVAAGPLAFASKQTSGEDYQYQTLAGFPTFAGGCTDASGTVAISTTGAAYAAGNDENWRLGRGGLSNAPLSAAAWLYGLEIKNC